MLKNALLIFRDLSRIAVFVFAVTWFIFGDVVPWYQLALLTFVTHSVVCLLIFVTYKTYRYARVRNSTNRDGA